MKELNSQFDGREIIFLLLINRKYWNYKSSCYMLCNSCTLLTIAYLILFTDTNNYTYKQPSIAHAHRYTEFIIPLTFYNINFPPTADTRSSRTVIFIWNVIMLMSEKTLGWFLTHGLIVISNFFHWYLTLLLKTKKLLCGAYSTPSRPASIVWLPRVCLWVAGSTYPRPTGFSRRSRLICCAIGVLLSLIHI